MLGSINQKTLHNRRIRFRDHRARGSIFPLFDNEGKTRALMITSSDDDQLMVVHYDKSLIGAPALLPRLRPQRFKTNRATLLQDRQVNEELLADLWHFDPWWVLDQGRYAGNGLVPALRASNLLDYDSTITTLRFTPTLSKVSWVTLTKPATGKNADGTEGSQILLKRFRRQHLRASIDARARAAGAGAGAGGSSRRRARGSIGGRGRGRDQWTLRPFWES